MTNLVITSASASPWRSEENARRLARCQLQIAIQPVQTGLDLHWLGLNDGREARSTKAANKPNPHCRTLGLMQNLLRLVSNLPFV